VGSIPTFGTEICYNSTMGDSSYNNSIFWIEVDKIKANPFQPRHEFNEDRLRDLSDSIRQYGVLQPLVVTRREFEKEDGGLAVEYELIAGERRWRASKLAGLAVVPAIIRSGEDTDKMKLELAIIENLQREDLNPIDRAQAFQRLVSEFNLKHIEVAKKIGKSREYVSNSLRILGLPQEVLDALAAGKITEGHTRPILMLVDRPEEQMTFFREIMLKRLSVRESEAIARRIAYDKVRRKDTFISPEIIELEERLTERFGTRVKVEQKEQGGKVTIDYFSQEDLHKILAMLKAPREDSEAPPNEGAEVLNETPTEVAKEEEEDLYFVKNFSV
jgi:ParB family transcriptional regulator, chromosome partitioning protein